MGKFSGWATTSTPARGRSTSSAAVALVLHLGPDPPGRRRRALLQGAQLGHRVHRRRRVQGFAVQSTRSPRTSPTSCARPSPASASTTPRSPVVTTSGETIIIQTEPLTNAESAEVDPGDHRHAPASPPTTSPSPRSAPAGVRRSPSAPSSASPSSWCWWCCSSGPTSANGRCRSPRSWRWPTTSSSPSASTPSPASRSRPATVTGLLTILGFSLYDTVVVFDKVRENTKNLRDEPDDVRPGREPRGQPDAGPLDQHLDRRADPGRRDPLRRRGPARLRLAEGPGARAVRRHGRRCLLLDLHRDPAARAPQGRETEVVLAEKRAKARAAAQVDRYASVPAFTDDMPVLDPDEPGGCWSTRRPRRPRRDEPTPAPRRATPEATGRGRVAPTAAASGRARARRPGGSSRPGSRAPSGARSEPSRVDGRGAREALERLVVDVPDFPEPGIVFKDITPLLADHTGVHRGRRGAGRGRPRRVRRPSSSTRWSAWRRAASSSPRRSRWPSAPASCRSARPASCRARPTPSPTRWSTARPRSRCTATPSPRGSGCCSSTTCSPPAAPSRRPASSSRRAAASSSASPC